jgi:hypothetical protein
LKLEEKLMKKRIISAALASLMAVSALSTSAFAALTSDGALEAAGSVTVPTLDVTVPTEASFIVNPYKLSVKVYTKDEDKTANDISKTDTLIPIYGVAGTDGAKTENAGWIIENNSTDVAVNAKMYAIAKAAKSVQINADANATDETKKPDPKKKQMTLTLKVGEDEVTLVDKAPTAWTDDAATTDVNEALGVKAFTLAKATVSGDPEVKTTGKAAITLSGGATVGTEAWTEADTVSLSMVFKFDMVAN